MIYLFRQKPDQEYRTFFGREACFYLKQYLNTRRNLREDSPLFVSDSNGSNDTRLVPTHVHDKLREMAEKAKYITIIGSRNPASAHSFRKAFSTNLTGFMEDSLIEYMLGHNLGSMMQKYKRFSDIMLREAYQKYAYHLEFNPELGQTDEIRSEYIKQSAEMIEKSNTLIMKNQSEIEQIKEQYKKFADESIKIIAKQQREIDVLKSLLKKAIDVNPNILGDETPMTCARNH
jgi:hypothetical protein